ncbi:hypothetical protein SNE40_013042 [Patella caerulea]|uniref:CCHC-type domain-containing protein n=1 Tax=Patella caerulea TaxID=87958 RepID=A0AAN8JNN9_PATCE
MRDDPAFLYDRQVKREPPTREKRSSLYPISNRKTNVYASNPTFNEAATNTNSATSTNETSCPIHGTSHLLTNCKTLIAMSCGERNSFLRETCICYQCCKSSHFIRDCRENVTYDVCGNNYYVTIMHPNNFKPAEQNGGQSSPTKESVDTKCTKLCGEFSGRSCGKNFLVDVYPHGYPEMTTRT